MTVVGCILILIAVLSVSCVIYYHCKGREVDRVRPYIANAEAEMAILREGIEQRLPNFNFEESMLEFCDEVCAVCLDK